MRTIKQPRNLRDAPPENPGQANKAVEQERLAVSVSYESIARKAIGGRVPSSLWLDAAQVADVPPDPKISRELVAAGRRQQSINDKIAVRVASAGNPAERGNPGSVTVMTYDTRSLDLAAWKGLAEEALAGGEMGALFQLGTITGDWLTPLPIRPTPDPTAIRHGHTLRGRAANARARPIGILPPC